MSLAELLPLIDNLSQADKLSLFRLLAAQIPDAELQVIFSASEYPVLSLYDATEAANILMQMIEDDQEASTRA
jgi:ADP-heptose:LPS heptosyltransferase